MLLFVSFGRRQVAGEAKNNNQELNPNAEGDSGNFFFAFWKRFWDIKAALESTRWSRSRFGSSQRSTELLYLPKMNPPSSCSQV